MENDSESVLSNVIKIDDERIKAHLDRIRPGHGLRRSRTRNTDFATCRDHGVHTEFVRFF